VSHIINYNVYDINPKSKFLEGVISDSYLGGILIICGFILQIFAQSLCD